MRGRAMRRAGAVLALLAAMVAGAWVALELAVRAVALPAGIGDAPPRTPVLLARISHKLLCETPREAGWDKAGAESGYECILSEPRFKPNAVPACLPQVAADGL